MYVGMVSVRYQELCMKEGWYGGGVNGRYVALAERFTADSWAQNFLYKFVCEQEITP